MYGDALMRCEGESVLDPSYQGTAVTVAYNQARLMETTHHYQAAEKEYKRILKQHPHYVDCECMAVAMATPLCQCVLTLLFASLTVSSK